MPTAPKELAAFGDLQRNLGQATMQAVVDAVEKPWKELYLDVRANAGETSHSAKLRVTPVSGAVISVSIPAGVTIAILEILQMRDACFSPPWYGMKLMITHDGQCQVKFDYERKCLDDPAFFQS